VAKGNAAIVANGSINSVSMPRRGSFGLENRRIKGVRSSWPAGFHESAGATGQADCIAAPGRWRRAVVRRRCD
jgi:hypothetical protein